MKIDRLDHLVLTVDDVDRSIAFYVSVLGMKHISFGQGRQALAFGRQKINLHPKTKPLNPHALQPTPGSADLCLIASTPVSEVIAHLKNLNVSIEQGPIERSGATGSILSVYFRDPDGNLIEVSNYVSFGAGRYNFRMPQEPDGPQDLYDLAPSQPKPKRVIASPDPLPLASPAPVLAYRSPPQTRHVTDTDTLKNLYIPLWLLAVGVVVEIAMSLFQSRDLAMALRYIAIQLILGTLIMLAGMLLGARLWQIELGNFWTAAFKLAAISVAPSAAIMLCSPVLNFIPFGWILGLIGEFVFYFALLGVLFDLTETETWYCVWTIFLLNLSVYLLSLYLGIKL